MKGISGGIWMIAALCLAAAEAPAGFWDMDFEDHRTWKIAFAGGGFNMDPEGKVGFTTSGRDIVFGVDALGIDDLTSGWGTIDLQLFQKHHLRVHFLPLEFEGDVFTSIALPPDDPVFEFQDYVESTARLYTIQVSYLYDFYIGKHFTISPLITLGLVDAKVEIRDRTLGLGWEESQVVPLPEIGLRIEAYPFASLGLFAEAKGFTIGSKATEWDVQGGASVHVNKHFLLSASYRVIDYDVDWFDVIVDTRFKGPFFGAHVRF
jgi:hypothetical protein